jgi:hypothetical protein
MSRGESIGLSGACHTDGVPVRIADGFILCVAGIPFEGVEPNPGEEVSHFLDLVEAVLIHGLNLLLDLVFS